MKILVWGLSIPWVLMLNPTAQSAETLSAESFVRSLNVTITLLEDRLQSQDQQAAPFAWTTQAQHDAASGELIALLCHEGPFLPLPKDINVAIEIREG